MTLYRKYRSQKLSELVGQPQVSTMLGQAIATQRIAHAYLFSGPRGTGKTSVARILAKAINCLSTDKNIELPCNECVNCLAINNGAYMDVVEIDAASNRGVDEARELRERVHIAASQGKYKVYILDEVHMLTNEAFNTLLKTIEEPPAHVVFILCTTESHKVPVTIASRCQRFVFSRAQEVQLQQHLKKIAEAEGTAIEDGALALLAQLADGGYRDGIMLLDQIITAFNQSSEQKGQAITRQQLEAQLGLASRQVTQGIIEKMLAKDASGALMVIESFVANGGEVRYLAADIVNQLRQLLHFILKAKTSEDTDAEQLKWLQNQQAKSSSVELVRMIKLIMASQQQKTSTTYPALAIEMAIIEAAQEPEVATMTTVSAATFAKVNPGKPLINKALQESIAAANAAKQKEAEMVHEAAPAAPVAQQPVNPPADLIEAWQRILQEVLRQNKSVGALLRHHCAPVSFDGSVLMLQFWNSFHQKQVEVDKNRILVEEIAVSVFGQPVKLRSELADKSLRPRKQPMSEEDIHNVAPVAEEDLAETAAEIFGGEFLDE